MAGARRPVVRPEKADPRRPGPGAADERIWEVHPEVSFAEAHGGTLEWPKSTWNGISLRRRSSESEGSWCSPPTSAPAGQPT